MDSPSFDPTPTALSEQGQLQHGVFCEPIQEINLDEVRLPGTHLWTSRFRMKQWQHWLISSPELAITMAIVDIGYLKLAWIQAIVHRTGQRYEWARTTPWSRCRLSRSLWEDQSHFTQAGRQLNFKNHLSAGQHTLNFQAKPTRTEPAIHGELRAHHPLDRVAPLVVCLPIGEGRAMYSHKVPLPVEGTIELDGQSFTLSSETSTAFSDIHKAHYPRHTWWDWACFAFHDSHGRIVGLNLTHGLAREPRRYNENALWLDGVPIRLGLAQFHRQRGDLMKPWTVQTDCGRVSLNFTPQGGRSEDLKLGLISSQFQQLYGHWSGTLMYENETLPVDGVFGLGEDHECQW